MSQYTKNAQPRCASASLVRRALLAGVATWAVATAAGAQTAGTVPAFPNRPVKLVVGYAAGGGVDAMARLVGQRLSGVLRQPVVVENRAGASGAIAADIVSKSATDGHTLLVADSAFLIGPHLSDRPMPDPLKSLTPVSGMFVAPLMVVASNELAARSPQELVAAIKAQPGRYSYATPGVGTMHHLGFELFKARTGSFIVHIPYRGAAQIVPDVMSGHVPLGVVSASAGLAQVRAGKVRAVAMLSPHKLAGAESVPALAQAVPGFDVAPRVMLLAPAGTPPQVVAQLDDAIRAVLAAPELARIAAQQGAIPTHLAPAALGTELARESAAWAAIIKTQKITAQ